MKHFREKHKFLFSFLIFSTIFAVIYYIYFILHFDEPFDILKGLAFFIPTLFVYLICFISNKTFLKHPKTTKIISAILITVFIGYFQILFYMVSYASASFFSQNSAHYTIDNYKEALNSSHKQTCISHFPKEIPNNAKDIEFFKIYNSWFGSEYIYLKFNIDKKYIEDELKNHKFKYIETIEEDKTTSFSRHNDYILSQVNIPYKERGEYTFYIIHDYKSETPRQNSFLYYYGIAVNNSKTTIVYFYINPD